MKIVEKKILPKWFHEVELGNKTFEYRKDEDDAKEGDLLYLREYDGVEYTGNSVLCTIGTIVRHADWEDVPEGFCIISIREVLNVAHKEDKEKIDAK